MSQEVIDDDEFSVKSAQYLYSQSLDLNEIQFSQTEPSTFVSTSQLEISASQQQQQHGLHNNESSTTKSIIIANNDIAQEEQVQGENDCQETDQQPSKTSTSTGSIVVEVVETFKVTESDDEGHHDILLSQGDQVLQNLNECGELTEIVGSESILTQELMNYNQLSQNFSQSNANSRPQSPLVVDSSYGVHATSDNYIVTSNSTKYESLRILQSKHHHGHIDRNLGSLLTAVHIVGSPAAARSMELESRTDDMETKNLKEREGDGTNEISDSNNNTGIGRNRKITKQNGSKKRRRTPKKSLSEPAEMDLTTTSAPLPKKISPSTTCSMSIQQTPPKSLVPTRTFPCDYDDDDDDKNNSPDGFDITKKKSGSNKHGEDCDIQIAHEAATLAARALKDQNLSSRLLLSLILTREKPGTKPEEQVVVTKVEEAMNATAEHPYYMPVGFQWCDFPPLEEILKRNRRRYYELSMDPTLRQTVEQLSFNNHLVSCVRDAGVQHHWIFHNTNNNNNRDKGTENEESCDPEQTTTTTTTQQVYNWTEKALRDRIRFYYKTNLQNARGRLQTMLKNPSKRSNAKNLKELYQLLNLTEKESSTSNSTSRTKSNNHKKNNPTVTKLFSNHTNDDATIKQQDE